MLSFLPRPLRALFSTLLFSINTIFWCLLLYPFAFVKFLIPISFVRNLMSRIMVFIAESWVSVNNLNLDLFQNINWRIEMPELERKKSYLVISNHASWMDIVILQKVANKRMPFFRFFLKKELIYVPLLGLAWWALDFPFMKRYSKSFLEKYPHKKGEDMKTTRKACEKFKGKAVSIINFLEGTRVTDAKKQMQQSPYKHLLKPKAGGIGFVLGAMGEQFDSILDFTIIYPQGVKSLGETFAGQLKEVIVKCKKIPIPPTLLSGNYLEDKDFRKNTQEWISSIWLEKDQLIDLYLKA